ncbi:hypothetical protein QPK31_09550 [Massilia sp. YIM B02769]|uniref:hypothetical protein n=1 Tax=unclassified Massilia TaxID=2609279 RepID=UPI0025B6FBC0|nr:MULTISPECIES: hypothetical protein [unclassified Massilia]MDN4058462.1 hypothetical protein [Massilia sp. YIM B02769]
MDTKDNPKDVKGRSWDQVTKDGTSSAGSMGTGGTGDIGSMSGNTDAGSSQQDTRTDDLLASGADEKGGAEGFQNPKGKGEIQTGMAGIGSLSGNGAGNRQKDEQQAQSEARGANESDSGSGNR